MAPSMFHLTLVSCIVASAVSDIMRAEMRDANVELHLSAHGDLRRIEKSKATKKRQNDMCNLDFPLEDEGKPKCNETETTVTHIPILDRQQCGEAAKQNHGKAHRESFLLDSNWLMVHPKGCFAAPCSTIKARVNKTEHVDHATNATLQNVSEGAMCYFYNPTDDLPNGNDVTGTHFLGITGRAVCKRKKYMNGTENDASEEGGCKNGYERIFNEDVCHKVGGCLSDPDASDFLVGIKTFADHFKFPRGCFIADDGEVYYNPVFDLEGEPIEAEPNASVTGTPLCAIERFRGEVKFPGS